MSSSKYANLPGVDLSEPDFFEISPPKSAGADPSPAAAATTTTNSSSSAATAGSSAGTVANATHEESLDVSGAFKKFLASNTGDAASSASHASSLSAGSAGVAGGLFAKANEAASERLKRLQQETEDFMAELQSASSESAAVGLADQSQATLALLQQAKALQERLESLRIERAIGAIAQDTSAASQRLVKQIESLKALPSDPAPGSTNGVVTYELLYKPHFGDLQKAAKVGELDRRLGALEAVIGTNAKATLASTAPELGIDTASSANVSIPATVAALSKRVALLDPARLDLAEKKATALIQLIESASTKKQVLEEGEKSNKINELFQLVSKWDSVASSVPDIVERLKTLKRLHEQCATFGHTLLQLQAGQTQTTDLLTNQQQALSNLQTALAENMTIVQENTATISQRIQALVDRLAKLS